MGKSHGYIHVMPLESVIHKTSLSWFMVLKLEYPSTSFKIILKTHSFKSTVFKIQKKNSLHSSKKKSYKRSWKTSWAQLRHDSSTSSPPAPALVAGAALRYLVPRKHPPAQGFGGFQPNTQTEVWLNLSPRKMNSWNLRMHPWKRKIIDSKPSFSGSMLIFRGVSDGWTNPIWNIWWSSICRSFSPRFGVKIPKPIEKATT